jgi:hypothetical protein
MGVEVSDRARLAVRHACECRRSNPAREVGELIPVRVKALDFTSASSVAPGESLVSRHASSPLWFAYFASPSPRETAKFIWRKRLGNRSRVARSTAVRQSVKSAMR